MEPTCTADGYTLHTCSCGYSYQSDVTEALGHDYHASNTEVGTVYTCSRYGDTYMDHTHSYTNTVVEPTCTAGGYTLHSCDCGYSYQDSQTDALGHNYVGSNTQVGTIYTCTRCDDSYTGHTHAYTETVTAPTCTEAGYTTYTCSCGDSYTGNNVAALGHNYVQSGDVYTCSRCGDSYSGHQHTYTETVTEPTCEQDGYTTYTCACGYSYTDNVVPALGHDYVLAGQDGTMWAYACTRCGHSYTVVAPIVPEPPVEYGLRRSSVSVTTEYHEYVYASGKLLREVITTTDADGNVSTQTLDFQYDNVGFPYALTYINSTAQPVTYYYITNMQGDVVYLVDEQGQEVAHYTYDPFGKVLSAEGDMADVNPLRYRGYFYDDVTGFYYLQSRYYDPAICRYINADSYLSTGQGFLGYNAFAYCANNPVNYTDGSGNFFDTIFDVISIGFSIADVIANPTDPWAWAGLAGDLIDLVPFVSGVGETVKAIGTVADVVDVVDDVRDAAKVVDAIDDIHDTGKIVDGITDAGDSFVSYTKMDGGCTNGWCFVTGTLVYTEDGDRAIEDIRVGDYVWATDPETGELELKQVLNLFRNVTEELTHIYVDGEEIVCTPGHNFYSPEYGWIDAEELQTGDVLVLPGGDYVFVEDTYTEELDLPVTIYNFEVEDFHTYFVGESHVLVHNDGCFDTRLQEIIDNPNAVQQYTPEEFQFIAQNSSWNSSVSKNGKGFRAWSGNYEIRYSTNGTRFDAEHFFGDPYWVVSSSKGGKKRLPITML